jgi:hypothetical protein
LRWLARSENKFASARNCTFGRTVDQLANRFDSLGVLAAQPGLGPLETNIVDMDSRSGQRRERHRLTYDGAASRVLGTIDLKHLDF